MKEICRSFSLQENFKQKEEKEEAERMKAGRRVRRGRLQVFVLLYKQTSAYVLEKRSGGATKQLRLFTTVHLNRKLCLGCLRLGCSFIRYEVFLPTLHTKISLTAVVLWLCGERLWWCELFVVASCLVERGFFSQVRSRMKAEMII